MNIQKTTTPHPFNRIKAIVTSYVCVNAFHPMRWASELLNVRYFIFRQAVCSQLRCIYGHRVMCVKFVNLRQNFTSLLSSVWLTFIQIMLSFSIMHIFSFVSQWFCSLCCRCLLALFVSTLFLSLLCIRSPACTDMLNRNLSGKKGICVEPIF